MHMDWQKLKVNVLGQYQQLYQSCDVSWSWHWTGGNVFDQCHDQGEMNRRKNVDRRSGDICSFATVAERAKALRWRWKSYGTTR